MNYRRWAQHYDTFYEAAPRGEALFYLDAIDEHGSPVLDIGVGTGRIAIPAALRGHRVVGVDLHRAMLDRARFKRAEAGMPEASLQLIEADMVSLDLNGRKFRTVLIASNTLSLILNESDQRATIAQAAAHLTDDGVLAFNIFNPAEELISDDAEDEHLLGIVADEELGIRHILTGINRFNNVSQINCGTQIIETLSEAGETVYREELSVTTRYLHHFEVLNMLHHAQLEPIEMYGDFDRSPLTPDSDEMIYVCRRLRSNN